METSNLPTFPVIDWVIALPEIALVSFLLMLLIYGSLNFLTPQSVQTFSTSVSSDFLVASHRINESKIRGVAAGLMKSRNVGWLAFLSLAFCFFLITEQSQLPLAYIWQDLVRVSEFITLTKAFISLVCLGLFLISFDCTGFFIKTFMFF